MSQNPLLEVELYAFASESAQFYLTPHEFDVDLDGNLYKSLALERKELALGAEAAKAGLDLKLPPNCDLVRHLLANSLTGDTTSITLRIGRRDTWGDYWWISGTRWMISRAALRACSIAAPTFAFTSSLSMPAIRRAFVAASRIAFGSTAFTPACIASIRSRTAAMRVSSR